MRERGILFSAPMVCAILNGAKTVTRRVATGFSGSALAHANAWIKNPYARQPGDRLWVRETWRAEELEDGTDGVRYAADDTFIPIENTPEASARWSAAAYSKGKRRPVDQWRPSIFLPRWASRITLDVVDLRVERLHEIDDADAAREGVAFAGRTTNLGPREDFAALWDAINGARVPWRLNPWAWRVEFKVAEVRHA